MLYSIVKNIFEWSLIESIKKLENWKSKRFFLEKYIVSLKLLLKSDFQDPLTIEFIRIYMYKRKHKYKLFDLRLATFPQFSHSPSNKKWLISYSMLSANNIHALLKASWHSSLFLFRTIPERWRIKAVILSLQAAAIQNAEFSCTGEFLTKCITAWNEDTSDKRSFLQLLRRS